jgi:adenosine deaminase
MGDDGASVLRRLPKVELHAHLNGSLPPQTLRFLQEGSPEDIRRAAELRHTATASSPRFACAWETQRLATANGGDTGPERIQTTLSDAFERFREVHAATDGAERVRIAARDCVTAFAADGCAYLELRTTPRALVVAAPGPQPEGEIGTSTSDVGALSPKGAYLEAVLLGVRDAVFALSPRPSVAPGSDSAVSEAELEFDMSCGAAPIVVRVIVSCNRALGLAEAAENVTEAVRAVERARLAPLYRDGRVACDGTSACDPLVVGVELSGDPTRGDARDFLGVLQTARDAGLRTSIHVGEVRDTDEETAAMLRWRPDRIGHAVFLNEETRALMHELRIPLEACLTSNLVTDSVDSYSEHHARELLVQDYPVVFCTDDAGIFDTSLSSEYLLAADHLHLSVSQLWALARRAMDYAFCSEEVSRRVGSFAYCCFSVFLYFCFVSLLALRCNPFFSRPSPSKFLPPTSPSLSLCVTRGCSSLLQKR